MGRFDGKVALVTGGASGIGERTARLLAQEGARVVVADLQEERGRAVAASLGESAAFHKTEVSREDQVRAAVAAALAAFGRLDVLVNNAGFGGALGPLESTPVEEWDVTFAVLVRGPFLGMKHAVPALRAVGGGAVVNIASVAGQVGGLGPHAYSAAKAALIQLTRTAALELAEQAIRVNAICPGFIATPLATNAVGRPEERVSQAKPAMARAQPIARPGEPEDIAQAVLWLASDGAGFVTGQTLVVDGGLTAGRRWSEQPEFFRQHRPLRVYRPEGY
jgi:NAD(P)-dependent dehydrogenase (short-subunit alcohol dehydrogenase family)